MVYLTFEIYILQQIQVHEDREKRACECKWI